MSFLRPCHALLLLLTQVTFGATAAPVHGGFGGTYAIAGLGPGERIIDAHVGYSSRAVHGLKLTTTSQNVIVIGSSDWPMTANATPTAINGVQPVLQHFSGKAGNSLLQLTLHWRMPGESVCVDQSLLRG